MSLTIYEANCSEEPFIVKAPPLKIDYFEKNIKIEFLL